MRVSKIKIKRFLSPKVIVRALTALAILYLGLISVYFFLSALSNALAMDTYAANGTFQLYNPLRRLMQGEVIGKDFPFFHGVGVPLLHFPAFQILGHNVFAADAAKWLMSPLVFLITSFIFFLAYFRKFTYSIIATAIFTILSLVCIDVVWPGNSLVGIRTTFPVLVAAYMIWHPSWQLTVKKVRIQLYLPILYILIGLAVACGTEQGMAVVVAYMLVRLVQHIRSKRSLKRWLPYYMFEGVYLALVVYIVLSILTLGHANEALHYALIDIPKDQGWYFGAPPNDFLAINTLHYILDQRVLVYLAPVIVGGLALFIISIHRNLLTKKEVCAFTFLLTYGLIVLCASIMGYWAPNAQLVPLTRVFGMLIVTLFIKLLLCNLSKLESGEKIKLIKRYIIYLCCGVVLLGIAWFSTTTYRQIKPFPIIEILKDTKRARHSKDDIYLSNFWKQRIESFEPYIVERSKVWSTYTGIYDSIHQQYNGSSGGEDYIIHALGPERRNQYVTDFITQKPDYAITLRPSYFWYEEWLWDRHWTFYRELATNYKIIADNDAHILWKRKEDMQSPQTDNPAFKLKATPSGAYQISPGKANHVRVYEITVNYTIKKPIPLADKMSRYLLLISGSSIQRFPVSLPPYENTWRFPVILAPGDTTATITPGVYGLNLKSYIDINSLSYNEIMVEEPNNYPYYDSYCSFGGSISYPDRGSQYHHLRCTKDELNFKFYQSQSANNLFTKSTD